jgi:hypothetical protein
MNAQPVVYDPCDASSASSGGRAAALPTVATADARAAAHDGTAEANVNTVRNPVWIMAIGMAAFFAAAVAVAALG